METLMIIFNGIVKFIRTAFSSVYLPITLSVICLGLGLLYYNTLKDLKNEKENRERDRVIMEQNFKAKTDSIKIHYDEQLKREVYDKTSFLVKDIDELKSLNKLNSN